MFMWHVFTLSKTHCHLFLRSTPFPLVLPLHPIRTTFLLEVQLHSSASKPSFEGSSYTTNFEKPCHLGGRSASLHRCWCKLRKCQAFQQRYFACLLWYTAGSGEWMCMQQSHSSLLKHFYLYSIYMIVVVILDFILWTMTRFQRQGCISALALDSAFSTCCNKTARKSIF